ncbi:MAG: hypothetical protein KF777_00340 [Planctomycetaceae bacterium]|nr:hypothetical protein [Planctomycetaceae bacterium]
MSADTNPTQATPSPHHGPGIPGRWVVIGLLLFGALATGGIYVYWNEHSRPFRPLRDAIAYELRGSRPQVEGGTPKEGPPTLRIAVTARFDPDAEPARTELFKNRVFTLAREKVNVDDYEVFELHLIGVIPESPTIEKSFVLSREELEALPKVSAPDPRDLSPRAASGEPPAAPSAAPLPKSGDEISAELQQAMEAANPGYDSSNGQFLVREGVVTAAEFTDPSVTSLAPLAGLKLEYLGLRGCPVNDLAPLRGMPIQELYLEGTKVTDLSALAGMPLRTLWLNESPVADLGPIAESGISYLNLLGTKVENLTPLAKLPLDSLWLNDTPVSDISPLRSLKLVSLTLHRSAVEDLSPLAAMGTLQRLHIAETPVQDLTPLANLRLQRLIFSPEKITAGLDAIRKMPSLTELDIEFREPQRWSPDEFWQRHDAGELTSRKTSSTPGT